MIAVPLAIGIAARGIDAGGSTGAAVRSGPAVYAQGMGATTADGYVVAFPLARDGAARQMFVDSTNGSDRYNGLSPYPGRRPNGTGRFHQYDATGPGEADRGWGPKATLTAAEKALPVTDFSRGQAGVGHQVLLAQGGTYQDASSSTYGHINRAAYHYGASAAHPYVIQSYDPADPWNGETHGRATGLGRAEIRLSADGIWNFNHGTNASGGLVSNFAFRGLRFSSVTGARTAPDLLAFAWNNIDSDNILVENCDLGGCCASFDNTSANAATPRWSRNLIVRRCLFDHGWSLARVTPALHTSGWIDAVIEDCVWNHATWADTPEGRFIIPTAGGADIFKHDIYNSSGSQWPIIVRRCVSIDPAMTFLSNRNNVESYGNVIIDAPIAQGAAGGVVDITREQPNGNWFDIHHNLTMGSDMALAGAIRFTGQPLPGSSFIRVGNVEFEFVAPGRPPTTGRNPITLGADAVATAANAVAALAARPEPLVARVTYRVFMGPDGPEIRQTPKASGTPPVVAEAYGANVALTLGLFRSWALAATNGNQGSTERDNLSVNSGFITNSGNADRPAAFYIGAGAAGRVSHVSFKRNVFYAWSHSTEDISPPAGTAVEYGTGSDANRYSDTSPHTNDEVYRAAGFRDKEALRAAIVAHHEQPWAQRLQHAAGDLFGFDFTLPAIPAPTATAKPASTSRPRVGDTVTFPDPAVTGGVIVSASTYQDNAPIPGTGKDVITLTLTPEHRGKRISRMVVVAPPAGGPATTVLTEIAVPVAW